MAWDQKRCVHTCALVPALLLSSLGSALHPDGPGLLCTDRDQAVKLSSLFTSNYSGLTWKILGQVFL